VTTKREGSGRKGDDKVICGGKKYVFDVKL